MARTPMKASYLCLACLLSCARTDLRTFGPGDGLPGGDDTQTTGGDTTRGDEAGDGLAGDPAQLPSISSFVDDFADGTFVPEWVASEDGGCSIQESGSHVQMILSGSAAATCQLCTANRYSLEEELVFLGVPTIAAWYPELRVFFTVETQQGDLFSWRFDNDTLIASNGATQHDYSYNASMGYWGIWNSLGEVQWVYSDDTSLWAWTLVTAAPASINNVQVCFGASATGPMASDLAISFSGLNTTQ